MTNNYYFELTSDSKEEDFKKLIWAKNLYIKLKSSNLKLLSKIQLNKEHLSIEIIEDCKFFNKEEIESFLYSLNPDRVIITLFQNIEENLLRYLNWKNISLDLYLNSTESLDKTLTYLLNKYPSINHFSLYPNNKTPLILSDTFLNFHRYHHNMWSKDPNKYYAYYDLKTIQEKKYIGLGKKAVSRKGYLFTKNNSILTLTKKYIDIQDHIDRLNYYLPISTKELNNYPLIDKDKYLKDISLSPVILVHQQLISNFL